MSIITLLQLAITLLVAAQTPGVSVEIRQQALDFANQSVAIATIELQTMQNNLPQPVEPQPQAPAPVAPAPQPTPDPVLGSATFTPEAPVSPYTVEITQQVPRTGGVLYFTVKKDNKPIEVIDKLTSNVTNQVFIRLPEDLPPGQGIFHIYIPEQTTTTPNPSLDLLIEGTTVNVPITFTQ